MLNINELSLEEKLGQMMMVEFKGNHINDRVKSLILKYKVGGFILYKKNYDNYSVEKYYNTKNVKNQCFLTENTISCSWQTLMAHRTLH